MNRAGELWLFDMDGTLFRSEQVAVPCFHSILARMRAAGMDAPAQVADGRILATLGLTHDRIWRELLGRPLAKSEQEQADAWLLAEEVAAIRAGRGALYDGVPETLAALRADGAVLAVASNGQQAYIEAIAQYFGLDRLFAGLFSAAGCRVDSKVELVRIALSRHPHARGFMVGDRFTDIEAGLQNGLYTIGCAFGFAQAGEFAGAVRVVRQFAEILAAGGGEPALRP